MKTMIPSAFMSRQGAEKRSKENIEITYELFST